MVSKPKLSLDPCGYGGNTRGAPCRKGQVVCQKKPTKGSRNTNTWLCQSSVGQPRKQRALAWWGGLSRSPLMSLCPGEEGLPLPSQTLVMLSRMAQRWELCYQAWEGAGVHRTHTRHAHTAGCWHQLAANTAAAKLAPKVLPAAYGCLMLWARQHCAQPVWGHSPKTSLSFSAEGCRPCTVLPGDSPSFRRRAVGFFSFHFIAFCLSDVLLISLLLPHACSQQQ